MIKLKKYFKKKFNDYNYKRMLKFEKRKRANFPCRINRYSNTHLAKKYIPLLRELAEWDNKIFFDSDIKGSIEIHFARLMLQRVHDHVESIINLIMFENVHSIYPVMRALVECNYLLRYVQKKPKYMKRFMNKTKPRGINIFDLQKEVGNKKLDDYYGFLSNMHHANPVCIKMSYYKVDKNIDRYKKGDAIISFKPMDYIDKYDALLDSLLALYFLALSDIDNINSKKWIEK